MHRPPGALFLEGSQMKDAGARLKGGNGTLRTPTSSVHGCFNRLGPPDVSARASGK